MNANQKPPTVIKSLCQVASLRGIALCIALVVAPALAIRAAEDPAVQKLLDEARAKQVRAQELRAAAASVLQKAADDQMEAGVQERDAKILTAQAMKLMSADANKQRAFKLRLEARKLWSDSHQHLIMARNAEQRSAQLTRNAEELRKAAEQLKDQPSVASTLENEAREDTTQSQNESQAASSDKFSAQALEARAKNAWAEAEKLDPETLKRVAPSTPTPQLVQPRQVK
ncbi:MAG TPA: hypothetical protein VFE51_02415 [Verrucomicrobiae bacterium]|nr:hypothetical protein [Verrucomicrobiae bacterium]